MFNCDNRSDSIKFTLIKDNLNGKEKTLVCRSSTKVCRPKHFEVSIFIWKLLVKMYSLRNLLSSYAYFIETPATNRSRMLEFRKKQRADPALERAARKNELEVDVDQVQIEHLASGGLFKDIFLAGDLYGIYEDLFGTDTMFIPSKDLQILYDYDDEYVTPVFRGIPYFHSIKSSFYF